MRHLCNSTIGYRLQSPVNIVVVQGDLHRQGRLEDRGLDDISGGIGPSYGTTEVLKNTTGNEIWAELGVVQKWLLNGEANGRRT